MMKTALAMLVLLAIAAAVDAQNSYTYINNRSSKPIRATTKYDHGNSGFSDRYIAPGTYDRDEIMASSCYYYSIQVTITVWVDGSVTSKEVTLQCDLSIVGVDNIDDSGVDIYQSVYGDINTPTGGILATIFPL